MGDPVVSNADPSRTWIPGVATFEIGGHGGSRGNAAVVEGRVCKESRPQARAPIRFEPHSCADIAGIPQTGGPDSSRIARGSF